MALGVSLSAAPSWIQFFGSAAAGGSHLAWREMASNIKMLTFLLCPKKHCQFIKMRYIPLHFWFYFHVFVWLCDRAISPTGMSPHSSPLFASPKQQVQSSCIHDIQLLSLYCSSIAPSLPVVQDSPADAAAIPQSNLLSGEFESGHSAISL